MKNGSGNGIKNGVKSRVKNEGKSGAKNGVKSGVKNGVKNGIKSIDAGIANGVISSAGFDLFGMLHQTYKWLRALHQWIEKESENIKVRKSIYCEVFFVKLFWRIL